MHATASRTRRILTLLVCVVVGRTVSSVLLSCPDYFPPNFTAGFLHGRQAYFDGFYGWAFYTHLVTGPFSLLNGLLLMHDATRGRLPRLHRVAGRVQVACVVLVAASGLGMSFYAMTGVVAGLGFALLAVVTAWSVIRGWKSAVRREFALHRIWMQRCYVLLCSAIILRFIGGIGTALGSQATWIYPLSAWACWVVPLIVFEGITRWQRSPWHRLPAKSETATRVTNQNSAIC